MSRHGLSLVGRVLSAAVAAGALFSPHIAGAAESRYMGTYYAVRVGADSLQDLTLTIEAGGVVHLVTRYPGLTRTAGGTDIYPYRELGTWSVGKDGSLQVALTHGGQLVNGVVIKGMAENTRLDLRLTDSVLATVHDANHTYGTAPLLFRKADCK